MATSAPTLITVGEIARRLGEPLHRVVHVIDSRKVQPIGRAGSLRVFAESDVDFVRSELRRIDEERNGDGQL